MIELLFYPAQKKYKKGNDHLVILMIYAKGMADYFRMGTMPEPTSDSL